MTRRPGRRSFSTRKLIVFIIVTGSMLSLYISLQFYESVVPLTSGQSAFLEMTNSKCPPGWTAERCMKRHEEVWASLTVNEELRRQMEESAKHRAQRDEYLNKRPQQLAAEQKSYLSRVQKALGDPLDNSLPYTPLANFSHNSFADLNILGFPKAGTSQLFKLLTSHPQAEPAFKRKEYCIDHGHFLDYTVPQQFNNPNALRALRKSLFRYHDYMLRKRSESPSSSIQFVNACLQPREVEYHLSYTPMPDTAKFLLLFRDPADWLWASWNFWIDKNLDDRPAVDHDWATVGIHYRSPELFHELILSEESTKSAAKRFRAMREQTVHVPRRLIHLLGKDRLLLLKSEDMKATNGRLTQFLADLAKFTGLSVSDFNATIAHGQTNCNAQKGYQNVCTGVGNSGAGYPITHYRPMLEETRKLIYIQFWEECKIWNNEFGIVYQECLNGVTT
jgi:Sulfotransferase domain